MTYPMVKPWLKYRRVSKDEFVIENEIVPNDIDEDPPKLPIHIVSFMQRLDGKTNPYWIDPSIDKQTARTLLRFLSKQGYLRNKMRNRDLGRFAFSFIKFDGRPKHSKIAVTLNQWLMLSWIPLLVIGFLFGTKTWNLLDSFSNTYLFGLLFGLITGLFIHEAGHTIAAIAYMTPVYEVGIRLSIFPTAYCFMKETNVKNRLKRTQIYAAGIETNFLVAGLFFVLAYLIQDNEVQTFFFYAALQNIILGIGNSSFFLSLDGFKIISTLLGADDMSWSMLLTLMFPGTWKEQIKRGASGFARMICITFLKLMQSIAVIWILYNAVVIFS